MTPQVREVIIIGVTMPAGADTVTAPPRPGWKAVSFLRCAFGASIIYEKVGEDSNDSD